MKLVQIGAGNIGRSFIGQLFSRAGYEVVFIDVDDAIVEALNRRHEYVVEVKDDPPATIPVRNVRAVHGRDLAACVEELATTDVAATAVGPSALPHVYPMLAKGLVRRREIGRGPLDLILCENLRQAAEVVREGLSEYLPPGFPLDDMAGLVETSIGKMVPIMTEEQRRADPLLVFAEAYNTLIVDKRAFRCGVPSVPGIDAKENMAAYVDQKLSIHNCGHAIAAYLAYLQIPGARFVWEAVADPEVREATRRGMWESAHALIAEYPDEFDEGNLGHLIEDLLRRFANRALGDAIHRIGRDVPRKLGREDRLIGSLLLDARHDVPAPYTSLAAAAAMFFRGPDESGRLYPTDAEFAGRVHPRGPAHVLRTVSGLDLAEPLDRRVFDSVLEAHEYVAARIARREPLLPLPASVPPLP
jgi:mannitol-1-phosphate 5-dehydrogenase